MTKEEWSKYRDLEYYPDRVCACGCGGRIKVQLYHKNRDIPEYIRGHNRRGVSSWNAGLTKETDPRIAEQARKMTGDKNPAKRLEVRKVLSEQKVGDKNPMKRPGARAKHSVTMREVSGRPEVKANRSAAQKLIQKEINYSQLKLVVQHRLANLKRGIPWQKQYTKIMKS